MVDRIDNTGYLLVYSSRQNVLFQGILYLRHDGLYQDILQSRQNALTYVARVVSMVQLGRMDQLQVYSRAGRVIQLNVLQRGEHGLAWQDGLASRYTLEQAEWFDLNVLQRGEHGLARQDGLALGILQSRQSDLA